MTFKKPTSLDEEPCSLFDDVVVMLLPLSLWHFIQSLFIRSFFFLLCFIVVLFLAGYVYTITVSNISLLYGQKTSR